MINGLKFEFIDSIDAISRSDWNSVFGSENPFTRHEFLFALENSKSVSPSTGWTARHLLVYANSELVAAMPLYLKTHSWGEYVFDWAWADAYERSGLSYYPKLVSSVPFTPVTGKRLAMKSQLSKEDKTDLSIAVFNHLNTSLEKMELSSWHCLFPEKTEYDRWKNLQCLERIGTQYHWFNRDYKDFADFLANMNSRKRKNILKERKKAHQSGLKFKFVEGNNISPQQWQFFIHCYQRTYSKRSGNSGYLNLAFFQSLSELMPEQVLLLIAGSGSNPFESNNGEFEQMYASALFFRSSTHLYGRYWGSIAEFDGVHFETCYYQGIEYCINENLHVFDAGAQGEHKIARGFEPIETWSLHGVAHPGFRDAIDEFSKQEKNHIKVYIEELKKSLPYTKNNIQ